MKHPQLLFLSAALCAANLGAQVAGPPTATLTGWVTNVSTGAAVSGVTVRIPAIGTQAVTNDAGVYIITGLAMNQVVSVEAQRLGYGITRLDNVKLNAATVRQNISMHSNPGLPGPTPPAPSATNPIYEEWRAANLDKRWDAFYAAAAGPEAQAKAKAAGLQQDPVMQFLFPPELVMAHQREINLQDAQRTKLVAAMTAAQGKFTESEWTLTAEQDKLQQLMQGTTIDEAAVEKQLDRILSMENDLKRAQLLMMVRVKNVLTPEQQAMLAAWQPCQPQETAPGSAAIARKKIPIAAEGRDGRLVPAPPPIPCGARKIGPGGDKRR